MEGSSSKTKKSSGINIIKNHDFSAGLDSWSPGHGAKVDLLDKRHARVKSRTEKWQGLEQDITNQVSKGSSYILVARVGISGTAKRYENVEATLRLERYGSKDKHKFKSIDGSKKSIKQGCWETLEGTFTMKTMPDKVVFYIEGPPPGIDILIESVVITCVTSTPIDNQSRSIGAPSRATPDLSEEGDIIINESFENRQSKYWSENGSCEFRLLDNLGNIRPKSGKYFACSSKRTHDWNGIQRDITGSVNRKRAYEVEAVVRLHGNQNVQKTKITATVRLEFSKQPEQYITVGRVKVKAEDKEWVKLQGKFLINGFPTKVVLYLEDPPPGVDILLDNLVVKRAAKPQPSAPPVFVGVEYGVNIITNSNFIEDTNGWFPKDGACRLSVETGSPATLPPMAAKYLGHHHQYVSGRQVIAKNRIDKRTGPAQKITQKVKPYLTYQVGAWVRIGKGASEPQKVQVKLDANGYINGGEVEIGDNEWHEIFGSFRIEEQAAKVEVYVDGPAPGIDLMLSGLHIFPVDRKARFPELKKQTDKIRKCNVELRISGSAPGTSIRVKQTQNSFPFGSCLMRKNIDNEDFTKFFAENFNWAVFANELKWYWTEKKQGKFNYEDADALLKFCADHNLKVRGHCIFWEVKSHVQDWVLNLNKTELKAAVEARLDGLLHRFKDKFQHYDVNNEMMHGSFYQKKFGDQIRADMFKIAKKKDLKATLFVNDYHVEDGYDADSSPEKYIEHIKDLQEKGAPVGGIGIQGHIKSPVGTIVRSALETMSTLHLPIWITELEVISKNEHIRADDLEVMLREAYAHPAVEGVMLWGFWELSMSKKNSHLVNAEGDLNEAGRRYIALKQEWLTPASDHIIEEDGSIRFRGFPGSYELEIGHGSKKVTKPFVINKARGEQSVVQHINL